MYSGVLVYAELQRVVVSCHLLACLGLVSCLNLKYRKRIVIQYVIKLSK